MTDEWDQMCGGSWEDEHAVKEREHRYDPDTQRCTCGALDHPDWGVTA